LLSEDGSEYSLDINDLIGLDFRKAERLLQENGKTVFSYHYRNSEQRRFTVLDVVEGKEPGTFTLTLAGRNPIAHLPSIYQENPFLEQFLWIFQHMQYEQIKILDILHEYHTPQLAPKDFLYWMAGWFGMNSRNDYDEQTVRSLLQKGLSLFNWRGTAKGLRMYLRITMGIEPEILENSFPQNDFVILGGKSVNEVIRNRMEGNIPFFIVHFPVSIDRFNKAEKSRIAAIVEQEKPAHAMFYISFEQPELKKQRGILIGDDQLL
jgi:phage tail-like protein